MEDMLVGIEQAAMRDIGATFVESKVEQARLAEDVDGAVLENLDGEPASLFRWDVCKNNNCIGQS